MFAVNRDSGHVNKSSDLSMTDPEYITLWFKEINTERWKEARPM